MTETQSQRLIDAQIGVLGSMLLDENCIASVMTATREQNFVSTVYRNIYRAIRTLFAASKPVDYITVRTQLHADTGADYTETLLEIRDCTPTAANVDEYVKMLNLIHNAEQKGETLPVKDLAASFSAAVSDELVPRTMAASAMLGYGKVAVVGGVAANSRIRRDLETACEKAGDTLYLPPLKLCGDNGAMIGSQGYYEYLAGTRAGTDLNGYANRDISLPYAP